MKKNNLFLLSLVFLVLFVLTTITINSKQASFIDNSVNLFLSSNQVNWIQNLSITLGVLFEPIYVILYIVILSTILYFLKKKEKAILLFLSSIAGGFFIFVLKHIFSRARPLNMIIEESSFSFPSGHALFSVILFGMLIYFCTSIKSKSKKNILISSSIFMIFIIGLSRLYIGVHWLSDIIAGYFFGVFLIFLILFIYKSTNFFNIFQKQVVRLLSK